MTIDDLRDEVMNGPKKMFSDTEADFRAGLDAAIESQRPSEPYRYVSKSSCCNSRCFSAAFLDGKQLDYEKLPEIWASLPFKNQCDIVINKYCGRCGSFAVRVA